MVYKLTQKDIDEYNLYGALVGEEATPEDLKIMGIPQMADQASATVDAVNAGNPAPMPKIDVRPQPITTPAQDAIMTGWTPSAPNPRPTAGMVPAAAPDAAPKGLMERLGLYDPAADKGGFNLFRFQANETDDPLRDLNSSQRMMLAFSAIQDAGAALQGREGKAFDQTMAGINQQRDMARKRDAEKARREAIAKMFGMGVTGASGLPKTQAELEAYAMKLQQAAASGYLDPTQVNGMIDFARKQIETQGQTEALGQSAVTAIDTAQELLDMVEKDPSITGFFGWALGNVPWSEASAARDLAKTLESKMALGALKELKLKSGATLGSVSEKELDLLASDIAKIDLNRGAEHVRDQLIKIQDNYKRILNEAYGKLEDPSALEAIIGMPFNQFISDSMKPKASTPAGGLNEEDMQYIGVKPN